VATSAGHIGLAFSQSKAVLFDWVGIAAHPACRLALPSVSAGDGALFCSGGRGPTRTGISWFCGPALDL